MAAQTLVITDAGRTMAWVKKELDVPAERLRWAIQQAGLLEDGGVFSVEVSVSQLDDAGRRFAQALEDFVALCKVRT